MILLAAALSISVCPTSGQRVTCVHDGDSIVIDRERIRIADIDTPELDGRCQDERRRAIRARDRLVQLLSSDDIEIRRTGKDRYRRTLAIVTLDGRSVGDILVSEGLARTWAGRREPWC